MSVILRVLHVTGRGEPDEPVWLESADIEAHDGRGAAEYTTDRELAMRFDDGAAAMEFWRQQSARCPLRDDGKPNRPLTALTIELEKLA